MKILGIETSCDETSASVVSFSRGRFDILSNIVASQISIHKKTGGVVPEVAAREHVKNILPVVNAALWDSQTKFTELDRIGVVSGPGLITSLMVGSETAKNLSYLWHKPIFSINHLEAHIAANFLLNKKIIYPALCLIVSGGHTEIVLLKKPSTYQLIGATRDDAAGECFDKCAKILGLPYPGGPAIAKVAEKGKATIAFPRPMINSADFDFSFSGLKTAVLYFKRDNTKYNINNVCASLQQAIIDVLIDKLSKAAQKYQTKTVLLAGGVAANKTLRNQAQKTFKKLLIPDIALCTDNAAMVAAATALRKKNNNLFKITVDPNYELSR
ncbi:MAG: tRNA (adenosine(37)-N6)-threonylcarbamoyltransferase complex transferase subunit TsaD [Patescibacteria group bacterium]|jgi:N6-L-threonylcarbamoyladenine synthase